MISKLKQFFTRSNDDVLLNDPSGFQALFAEYYSDPLRIPVVDQSIKKISESISMLPMVCKIDPVIQKVLDRPNDKQSTTVFLLSLMRSLLIDGNGYIELITDFRGSLIGMFSHFYTFVSVEIVGNDIRYRVRDNFGNEKILLEDEILHIRTGINGGIMGVSSLSQCQKITSVASQQVNYLDNYLKHGAKPSGVLEMQGKLSKEGQDRLLDAWNRTHGGSENSGRPALLQEGMQWKSVPNTSMVDSDYYQIYTLMIVEICRIFNISPLQVGDLSVASYNNATEATKSFLSQTLHPWLCLISGELEHKLELPKDSINFDLMPLKMHEQSERFDSYKVAIEAGFMTAQQAAEREGIAFQQ